MMLGHPFPGSTKLQADEGPNTIRLRLYEAAGIVVVVVVAVAATAAILILDTQVTGHRHKLA